MFKRHTIKKGQTTVEFLIILVITMTIFTTLVFVVNQQLESQTNIFRSTQAQNTINAIISAAELTYSEGSGSSRAITITIPDGIEPQRTYIDENYVNIALYIGNDISDINGKSSVKLLGSLPKEAGTYTINVISKEGYVVIGERSLDATPTLLVFQMKKNELQNKSFKLQNRGSESFSIILDTKVPSSQISITTDKSFFTLTPNEDQTVLVTAESKSSGLHTGYIDAIGNFNESIRIYIQVDARD
ncbi:hypothetical protein HY570_02155 [Candidatus Micrarchaeota archaeon]|nr:hypothetical protein [Candidatus Micrarchaeota archaeon]